MKNKQDEYGDILDAYGHLNWCISMRPSKNGGDWLACFDARRVKDGIEYEVIVNSDSGGFIDTLEGGIIPLEKAKDKLFYLVERWKDIGSIYNNMYCCKKVAASWRRHIKNLIKQEESEFEEDYCEYETPQEMGWVGKDGRP